MVTVPTHTSATPHTLALPRWRDVCRRVADALHARADRRAWDDGLTVSRVGLTGREYRSPLFDRREPLWKTTFSTEGVRPPVDDGDPFAPVGSGFPQAREGVA